MEYIDSKLEEAKQYLYNIIGKKDYYTFDDVYKLLKSFTFTLEIDFSDLKDYISQSLNYDNIIEFSKGFIIDKNYKIYAINYGSGFVIIVVSSANGYNVTSYYGNIINDFTLKIYYALEIMCKNFLN